MPKFKFGATCGFVGCDDEFIVNAPDEESAYKIAAEYWLEIVAPEVYCENEIDEDDEDFEDYEEIN